ncbi:MAG TPA: iron-sulfur cluster assembly accessory protein [Candidatus Binatia bacterium]|nr:iron-sulfur cluster assembly accessory protein [Candidatus Binatia bacterium]
MVGDITMTDRAVEKIQRLLAGANKGHGLRVKIVAGGCSGFEYKMVIDGPTAEDEVFERSGARILLDPESFTHLNGTELDYKDELMQSGFVFNNPNAKGTCGCGTSFST